MQLGCRLQASIRIYFSSRGTHAAVGDRLQLLERQAERHGLEGVEVVHHELTPFCQHHDGCGVIKFVDGGLGGDEGTALDRPKPGDAVRQE